jgi:hypothetical protein
MRLFEKNNAAKSIPKRKFTAFMDCTFGAFTHIHIVLSICLTIIAHNVPSKYDGMNIHAAKLPRGVSERVLGVKPTVYERRIDEE